MKNKINSRPTAGANLISAFILDFFLLKELFEVDIFLFAVVLLVFDLCHGPGVDVPDCFQDGFHVKCELYRVGCWFGP
jgi:hypothetical protein